MGHDIHIIEPFVLDMDILDFEEMLPSVQMSFHFELKKVTHSFLLEGNAWFRFDDFDVMNENFAIKSMDNDFCLRIDAIDEKSIFHLTISYRTLTEETADFKYEFPLDSDDSKRIKGFFRDIRKLFPK